MHITSGKLHHVTMSPGHLVMFACIRGSFLLILLAACAGQQPAPVAVLQAAPLPSGWQPVELPGLQLALPAEWSMLTATDTDQSAAIDALAAQHPQLEALLRSAAADLAAGNLELLAVDLAPAASGTSGYPASIRVGRQTYDAEVALDAVGDANERDLRSTPAFAAITREPVRIGEHAAERLRSQLSLSDKSGEPLTLTFEQYLLVSGRDVVVLTFAAAEDNAARYRGTWDGVLSTLRLEP